jgi:hypothetical protein
MAAALSIRYSDCRASANDSRTARTDRLYTIPIYYLLLSACRTMYVEPMEVVEPTNEMKSVQGRMTLKYITLCGVYDPGSS